MTDSEQQVEVDSNGSVNGSTPINEGAETISNEKDQKLNGALEVPDGRNDQKEKADDVNMSEADNAMITGGLDSEIAETGDLKKKEDGRTEGGEDVREEEVGNGNEEEAENMQKNTTEDVSKLQADDAKEEVGSVKDVDMGGKEVEVEKMETDKNVKEEARVNTGKKNEENPEVSKIRKVRGKATGKGKPNKKKEIKAKSKEVSTPVTSSIKKPVRERKSVERLVEALEKQAVKPFIIEKGRGTPLKDIPNVLYKLTKKKPADLRLLHQIIFGRVGKSSSYKNHILQFSGFVWHESEDKGKTKIKEKLDKCVRDTLIGFCDIFDLAVSRAHARKEELVATLLEFMVAPHATRDVILCEIDQSAKSKKRKRGRSSGSNSSGRFSEKRSKMENMVVSDGKEGIDETEDEGSIPSDNDIPTPEHADSKDKYMESKDDIKDVNSADDHDEAKGRKQIKSPREEKKSKVLSSPIRIITSPKSAKSEAKLSSSKESRTKDSPEMIEKEVEAKDVKEDVKGDDDDDHSATGRKETKSGKRRSFDASKKSRLLDSPKKMSTSKSAKSSSEPTASSQSKTGDKSKGSGKASSRKKKEVEPPKQKTEASKQITVVSKSHSKEKEKASGKKSADSKSKSKRPDESGPSKEELRKIIIEILSKVDFNTATFTDILKELANHFGVDLRPRKAAIKLMIQEKLTKLAEAENADEDDDATGDDRDAAAAADG